MKNSNYQISVPLLSIVICGLAASFYVYDYFIQVSPSVMTQQLMEAFNIGAGELGILGACFYYSYTFMQIPAGMLLDKFGARYLLTIAVIISACGVTLFGTAHSFAMAGFARFLIGLGSSFAFVSTLFLVSRWFAHRYFAMIAGLVQLGGGLGSIFGLAPLAMAINHFGWRETLVSAGIITFSLALIFWLIIRDGLTIRATPIMQTQIKKQLPLLLRKPQLWWIAICGLLSWVPVAVIGALWGVPYLMQVFDVTNTFAGQLCSLFWIGLAFGSPIFGWYTMQLSKRRPPILICFAVGIVGAAILVCAPYLPLGVVAIGLLLSGTSASVQSLSFGLVKDIVPPQLFGTASGINNMAAIIGGAISQPLVGFLLHLNWAGKMLHHTPVYEVSNYQYAFLVLPIAAVLGCFVTWAKLRETHCEPINT